MQIVRRGYLALAALAAAALPAAAQLGTFSDAQRAEFTRAWKGERFPDGCPKAPDSVLARMKTVSAGQAWGVLRGAGYRRQFEGGWQQFNSTGERLVGRVVTAFFLPRRPDFNEVIEDYAKKEGRAGRGQNSWVIDTLVPGGVLVVDWFGKIVDGAFLGGNLATSI